MSFKLTILAGPDQGRTFTFDRVQITIGRTMENDVVLTDPGISRKHLSIRDKGGAYIVTDLGSSNGTKLNGKPIKQEVLNSGDVLELGGARVRFDGATAKEGIATSRGRGRVSRARARPAARVRPASARPRAAAPPRPASGGRQKAAKAVGPAAQRVVIRSQGMKSQAPRAPAVESPLGHRGRGVAAGLIARARHWFFGLDKRKRLLVVSAGALVLLLLVVSAFRGGRQIARTMVDHSGEVFAVGGEDNGQPASYGIGSVTYRCRESVTLSFKYASGRATVKFRVAGIDNKDELVVLLNEVEIGRIPPPLAVGEWSDELKWDLPRKHLLENDINKLTFINNVNRADAQSQDEWAVMVEAVVETPLPEPDKKAAEENFLLAQKRYESKNIAPENLYFALKHYRLVRDYLELIPENSRPAIYNEATEMIAKIEKELQENYKKLMFTAERDLKYGRVERAQQIYKRVMDSFPDQEDPRHQRARAQLESLQ